MISIPGSHHRMWRGFGSPMLKLPVAAPKVRPQSLPNVNLSRSSVLWTLGLLLALSVLAAAGMIHQFYPGISEGDATTAHLARNLGFGGGVFGFSLVLLTRFYPHWAPLTAPVYALAGGVFMSGIALALEHRFPGVAVQSVILTLSIFLAMWTAYATGLVRVTRRLFVFVYAATASIALVYLVSLLLILTGVDLSFLHGAGTGGALWFGFIVVIASLNLLVDFQRLRQMVDRPSPAFMRWYVGLSLHVTLVWMYVSVVRLLANLRR